MSDELGRARAQRPTITCGHCGGNDFVVVIANLAGHSELRCVRYDEHVQELDLEGKIRQLRIQHGLDPDEA